MFSGRIGRLGFLLGYLYLQLPMFVVIFAYMIINAVGGDLNSGPLHAVMSVLLFGFGAVWTIFYFIVSIDLSVRRWHDIDQTGWLAFLYFVPIANFVAAVVQLVVPGNPEINRYGTPVSGLGIRQVLFHRYPAASPIAPQPSDPPVSPIV